MDKIIIELFSKRSGYVCDMEIPLNITGNELVYALQHSQGVAQEGAGTTYLTSENPVALIQGNTELIEYGLRDGTRIYF